MTEEAKAMVVRLKLAGRAMADLCPECADLCRTHRRLAIIGSLDQCDCCGKVGEDFWLMERRA